MGKTELAITVIDHLSNLTHHKEQHSDMTQVSLFHNGLNIYNNTEVLETTHIIIYTIIRNRVLAR